MTAMRYLTVKNWREHQHYKKRSPPWIKLHRAITEDYAFAGLRDKTKAHLMLIWIIAAGEQGRIPHDAAFVAKRINASESVDLEAMIAAGFLLADETPGSDAPEPETTTRKTTHLNRDSARRILVYLNEQASKNFQPSDANLSMIEARLEEYDETTLRGVIVDRVGEWKDNEAMREFLRPATLFNKTKCAQYVGELPK